MPADDMERTLADLIPGPAGGSMNAEVAIAILRQIGAALIEMDRQNLVHTALTPYNIRVSASDPIRFLGLAAAEPDGSPAIEKDLAHTLPYMAPELLEGSGAAFDIRADIYSVGAMAYQMFTGHLAVDARTLRE